MSGYYKAVRPDGTDWWTGTGRWLPEDGIIPEGGWLVEHPDPGSVGDGDAAGYLSVATVPTDCTGMGWPSRLLRVEPVGEVWSPDPERLPHKRAAHAWRVVGERPGHEALGPQGREVAALLERIWDLTPEEASALRAARDAAWGAAREAAGEAARDAAWYAALNAARDAVLDVVMAVLVRDLITPEQYDTLTGPWRTVTGDPSGKRIER